MARTSRGLRRIEIATHCVPDVGVCIAPYQEFLNYRLVAAGAIPQALAEVWATPGMAGRRYALLQPESGAPVYLRFIETGNSGGYWPPVTQGWLSTEILATDPDAVLELLRDTAFSHVSGPIDLFPTPKSARALQMAGPAGELMYFTRLLPGGSRFALHGATTFVDRPFIIMLGGTSMTDFHHFYGTVLGQRLFPMAPFPIKQMSRVLELPEATTYPVTMAGLPGRSFMLELEELPADVERRTVPPGQLPEGLAMISFASAPLAELALEWRATPQAIECAPYSGRRVVVVEGPAGEWLELID